MHACQFKKKTTTTIITRSTLTYMYFLKYYAHISISNTNTNSTNTSTRVHIRFMCTIETMWAMCTRQWMILDKMNILLP